MRKHWGGVRSFTLEKRRLRGTHHRFPVLQGWLKEDRGSPFTRSHMERQWVPDVPEKVSS